MGSQFVKAVNALRVNTSKMKSPLHFLTLPKPKDSTDVYRAEAVLASSSHISSYEPQALVHLYKFAILHLIATHFTPLFISLNISYFAFSFAAFSSTLIALLWLFPILISYQVSQERV